MKVTEHVYFYLDSEEFGPCSNSMIVRGKKQILIDPGNSSPKHLEDLKSQIEKDGLKLEATQEIWLTHAHPDHTQAASLLVNLYHHKVRCHPLAAQILKAEEPFQELSKTYLEGLRPFEKLSLFLDFLLKQTKLFLKGGKKLSKRVTLIVYFFHPLVGYVRFPARFFLWFPGKIPKGVAKILERIFGKWHPISLLKIREVKDGEIIKNSPDIQILFLPGHSPDEIGFWIEKEKVLIIGDLIPGEPLEGPARRSLVLVSPVSDLEEGIDSLDRIRKLDSEVFLPAHGKPIIGKEKIDKYLSEIGEKTERIKIAIKKT